MAPPVGTTEAGIAGTPQPAIAGVPVTAPTPRPYIAPATAEARLSSRYALSATLLTGHLLVASMRLDEEAPFLGVKLRVQQDREWPRSFKYGWPNMIATPSPVMVSSEYGGAWYLDYEGVVPEQIVDWVCLEAYRLVKMDVDKVVESEGVTGASVHYAPPAGYEHGIATRVDELQRGLISPFQKRQAHKHPFLYFGTTT